MFNEFYATRDAYGDTLLELGKENPDIVVLDADLSKSTKTEKFAKAFPERFFDFGIAEANMVSAASGLASVGKIPFISSFACFLMCKGFDQLRMCVAYPGNNVKVVVSHGGISIGEDGPSQQGIEDVALARSLPGFKVIVPSDKFSTRAFVRLAAATEGPVFIRTGRNKVPVIYPENEHFEIGKGKVLREGKDVVLIACGLMVSEAVRAADMALQEGLSLGVIDMASIKPLDEELLLSSIRKYGAVVTAEEHLLAGGLGEAVAGVLARHFPAPVEMVGLKDTYAESATPDELVIKYGLSAANILESARKAAERR